MPQFSVDLTSNQFVSTLSKKDCTYLHDKISHTRFLENTARKVSLPESKLYDAGKTMVNIIRILMDTISFSAATIIIDNETHHVESKLTIRDIKLLYDNATDENEPHRFSIYIEYTQRRLEDTYFGKYIINILDRGVLVGRLSYEQDDHDMMTYDMNFPAPSILLTDILNSIKSILDE